jgi:predicted ATPase
LQDCLGLVRLGRGRLSLVYGEAGIGKSALVDRFCSGQQRDIRILRGAFDALSTPRPLGPLLDIAPQAGGRLADLVFEGAEREELFAAFLEALTGRRPTVVVIEDLHWADDATLDLIKFAGRRVAGRAAMLILTYRDDEIHNDHPLRLVLGDLASGEPLADLLDAVDLEPQPRHCRRVHECDWRPTNQVRPVTWLDASWTTTHTWIPAGSAAGRSRTDTAA